jgi:hypothetical protein
MVIAKDYGVHIDDLSVAQIIDWMEREAKSKMLNNE